MMWLWRYCRYVLLYSNFLQYSTASGVNEEWNNGADGAQYRSLVAFKMPSSHSTQDVWTNSFNLLSLLFSDLATPMEVTINTPEGYLLVIAEISRIQTGLLTDTFEFNLSIDGATVAETK